MKRWIRRLAMALAVMVIALLGVVLAQAQRTARPVGFEIAHATDVRGRTFPIAIWYPTRARPWPTTLLGLTLISVARDAPIDGDRLPLVVMSHGNHGGPGSHVDLAMALADAGYVVAAPMHTGDNQDDDSGVGQPGFWSGRNRQLQATIDAMTTHWHGRDHVDAGRIGAFGFSAGAFTVLTAIGGRADMRSVQTRCAQAPEFVCAMLKTVRSGLVDGRVAGTEEDFHVDPRIRAAVVAAPGLGFTFSDAGLADVRVPVQLWVGDRDVTAPVASNADVVRRGLGPRVEAHVVPGAAHLSFLAPCPVFGPPALCDDTEGFDRAEFHRAMNADVRRFFDSVLQRRAQTAIQHASRFSIT